MPSFTKLFLYSSISLILGCGFDPKNPAEEAQKDETIAPPPAANAAASLPQTKNLEKTIKTNIVANSSPAKVLFRLQKDVRMGDMILPAGTEITEQQKMQLFAGIPEFANLLKTKASTDNDLKKAVLILQKTPKTMLKVSFLKGLMRKTPDSNDMVEILNQFPESFVDEGLSKLQDELNR